MVLGVVPGVISGAVTDAKRAVEGSVHSSVAGHGVVPYPMLVGVDTLMVSALGCGERIEGVVLFICRLQSV